MTTASGRAGPVAVEKIARAYLMDDVWIAAPETVNRLRAFAPLNDPLRLRNSRRQLRRARHADRLRHAWASGTS